MVKIFLTVILTIFALQCTTARGSNGHSSNNEIDIIVAAHDIDGRIQRIQQDVDNILKQENNETQHICGSKIHTLIADLAFFATSNLETCVIQAKQSIAKNPENSTQIFEDLHDCLFKIIEKINSDSPKIISALNKCIKSAIDDEIEVVSTSHDFVSRISEVERDSDDLLNEQSSKVQIKCVPLMNDLLTTLRTNLCANLRICVDTAKDAIGDNKENAEQILKDLDGCLTKTVDDYVTSEGPKIYSKIEQCVQKACLH